MLPTIPTLKAPDLWIINAPHPSSTKSCTDYVSSRPLIISDSYGTKIVNGRDERRLPGLGQESGESIGLRDSCHGISGTNYEGEDYRSYKSFARQYILWVRDCWMELDAGACELLLRAESCSVLLRT